MRSGRPRSFDEEAVLEKAMHLFWSRGYQRLGLRELLEHLAISRQSLYDAFGSKRALFVRAIEHYRATQLTQALALLEREGSPLENVKAVLGFFAQLAEDASCRGCLVANALVEMGPHDAELSELLAETLEILRGGLERGLAEAQRRGELRSDRSSSEISRALVNAMLGLAVMGRLPLPPASVAEIHAGTLRLVE